MKGTSALAAGLMMLVAGCSGLGGQPAHYGSVLTIVDRPVEAANRYGPAGSIQRKHGNYLYEDNLVSSEFSIASRINFAITNHSEQPMKIIWSQVKVFYPDQHTGRIQYSSVKHVDLNALRPPTTIDRKESLFVSTSFPKLFASAVDGDVSQTFGLLIPIEHGGVVNEYTFWFDDKDAPQNREGGWLAMARAAVTHGPDGQH